MLRLLCRVHGGRFDDVRRHLGEETLLFRQRDALGGGEKSVCPRARKISKSPRSGCCHGRGSDELLRFSLQIQGITAPQSGWRADQKSERSLCSYKVRAIIATVIRGEASRCNDSRHFMRAQASF